MTLSIVDYGAGNILSVMNAFEAIGEEPVLASTPEALMAADRLVLPGVGAAAAVLGKLRQNGMDQALREAVVDQGRPLLGICVGMQVLATTMLEFGETAGLGWMAGETRDIRDLGSPRAPHMGWNQAECGAAETPFHRQLHNRSFYFCHSFAVMDAPEAFVVATTSYGGSLTAAVGFGTVLATQFHPEKSQLDGQRLLEAFVDWAP
ncbi:MAG: imidazole glycerol phosphate synthase subunit HisH [Rhodospirillales bacterium]